MRRRILSIAALSVGAALVLGVAACGGDDETSSSATTRATTPAGGATTGGGEAAGETTAEVTAEDFNFDPKSFSVAAGEEVTVTLDNKGSATHTLTVFKDEGFTEPVAGADTKNVSAGSKGEFKTTFTAGEYYFRCQRHPTQMQGEFDAE
jgi:plastocyanin